MVQFIAASDIEQRIAEQWPAIAPGTVHDLDGECRCGLRHKDGHTCGPIRRALGFAAGVEFGVYVADDIGDHLITVTGALRSEPDEWGRTSHGKTIAVVVGYAHVETVWTSPLPPPDRPAEAVDSIDWTDPDVIVVTRWDVPRRHWTEEFGYSPNATWEPHVSEFTTTGKGNWAAIYWQYQQPYAVRMSTKREAEMFLRVGEDHGDLWSVGVARKGEKR